MEGYYVEDGVGISYVGAEIEGVCGGYRGGNVGDLCGDVIEVFDVYVGFKGIDVDAA